MKTALTLVLTLAIAGVGFAQTPNHSKAPIRLKIRHADPWFVKAMLEGIAVSAPEMSSRPGFQGLGNAATQGLGKLLKNGRLIVNPTDNSLWFFPD
jgi:hypothetical protein